MTIKITFIGIVIRSTNSTVGVAACQARREAVVTVRGSLGCRHSPVELDLFPSYR